MDIQIKLLSNDETFIDTLAATPVQSLPSGVSLLELGEPAYVPGAVGSWYEILGAIGAIGFPVGVIGNILASWIWQAMTRTSEEQALTTLKLTRTVKLVLRSGEKVVDVHIESVDLEAIRVSVETALAHVDKQP